MITTISWPIQRLKINPINPIKLIKMETSINHRLKVTMDIPYATEAITMQCTPRPCPRPCQCRYKYRCIRTSAIAISVSILIEIAHNEKHNQTDLINLQTEISAPVRNYPPIYSQPPVQSQPINYNAVPHTFQRPNSRNYREYDESYPPLSHHKHREHKPNRPFVEIPSSHPIMIMISESTRRRRMPPPYRPRRVQRTPRMRAYIYGYRTSSGDDDDEWSKERTKTKNNLIILSAQCYAIIGSCTGIMGISTPWLFI